MTTGVGYASTVRTRYRHELWVTLLSQDVAANTSRIGYLYKITNTGNLAGGSWNFDGVHFHTIVNGEQVNATLKFDFRTRYFYDVIYVERTVVHNSDGSASFTAALHGDANPTSAFFLAADASTNVSLPPIPRASTFTVSPNSVIEGGSTTVSISRASAAFTHDVTWSGGGTSGTIATGVATSVNWTPPTSLLATTNRVSLTVTVQTKNGATPIGSPVSHDITFKAPPVYPEVGQGTPFDVRLRRVVVEGGNLVAKETIPYLALTTTDTMSASGSCKLEVAKSTYATSLDEAVVVADMYDGSQWLDTGLIFVLSRTESDAADLSEVTSYTGMSYVDWLLSKVMIPMDFVHPGNTPGDIINYYMYVGQQRGWGTHLGVSFTAADTSVHTAWQNTDPTRVTRGTPVSQVLNGYVSDVLAEYRTRFEESTGKAWLDMFNPGYGEDWSIYGADPIVNLELAALNKVADTAPIRKDSGDKVTRVFITGDEASTTRESAANVNPIFGHLEGSATASGVTDMGRLNQLGDAILSVNRTATVERTFSYDLSSTQTPPQLFPYRTFSPGDWILIPGDNGPERARVSQVAITRNSEGTKATITTGDLIPSGLAATARKISQASGGAISGGTLRAPLTLSSAIPAAPVNVTTILDGYWTTSGAPASGVAVSWDAVRASMQGTPLLIDLYEVWTREEEGDPYTLAVLSDTNSALIAPVAINQPLDIKIRGRSTDGVYGEFSDPESIVTVAPDETLAAPATPFLEVDALGTVAITWSGTIGASAPPLWFNYVQAEISDAQNGAFTPAGQQLSSKGTISVPNVGAGLWWFRLAPYDMLNVRGAASPAASINVVPLVTDTRQPKAPTGVAATSTGFWDGSQPKSRMDVSWTAVTKATDDSDIDILVYEVWGKVSTDAAYKWLGATEATSISLMPESPVGVTWDIQVVATATNNVPSDPSTTVQVVVDSPDMAMGAPTPPILTSAQGLIFVSWNGKLLNGATPYTAPDFVASVDIQVSTDSGATWPVVGFMTRGSKTQSVAGVTPGNSARVRLVAYDSLGQPSAASAYATITVVGVDLGSLDQDVADAIDAAHAAGTAAQTAANNAATAASTAQSTANTAVTNAATAQSAATAADTKAVNAKSAADAAQSDADAASTAAAAAAGIANSKAVVLYQSTTPTSTYQNALTLWIDTTGSANTPKRWTGSAWVAVTDKAATDAASAAATAQSTANTAVTNAATAQTKANQAAADALAAATAAGNAQTTANGKNTVWYQGTAPSTSGNTTDDIWFDTDDGNKMYRWSGSAWTAAQFGTNALADLAINTAKIAANAITVTQIANNAVTAGKIAGGAVDSTKLATAINTAITTAQSTADSATIDAATAQAAATSAQSDADAANAAALAANNIAVSKGKVIYSTTAPTGADAASTTLWIDTTGSANTPKRWVSGTTWAVVTDKVATDAAALAATANSTANTAKTNAATAQAKADSAFANAATAQSAANAAQGDANTALSNAATAQTAANTAKSTADTAVSNAAAAQSDADAANAAALAASGLAATKGKVLVQSTAPGVDDRNAQTLWIDTTGSANTPKRWVSGTTWAAVTDKAATDAAAAAASAASAASAAQGTANTAVTNAATAQTAANNAAADAATAQQKAVDAFNNAATAQGTANTALSTANGKNKTIFSTSAASGTTGYVAGDIWFQKTGSIITGQWEFVSGAWAARTLDNAVIANIDAGKINAGFINALRIQAGSLSGDKITAGTLAADRIVANSIGATQIAADAITASELAANAVLAVNIMAGNVTAGKLATDSVVAGNIAAGAVQVGDLAADSVTATNLAVGAITASKAVIANGAIQTAQIANLAVTDAQIGNLNASKITAGTINAARIGAGTISADKLLVGDFTNLASDGSFTDTTKQNWGGSGTVETVAGEPNRYKVVTAASGNNDQSNDNRFQVTAGDIIYVEMQVYGETTNVGGGGPNIHLAVTLQDGSKTWPSVSTTRATVQGVWTQLSGYVTIPTGAISAVVEPAVSFSADAVGNIYYFRQVVARRAATGELIVDGAITARKIDALAVTAEKLAANSVAAVNIQGQAITADHMSANSVTAYAIAADAITANKIKGGEIQTSHLSSTFAQDLDISSNGSVSILTGLAATAQTTANTAASDLANMRTRYDFTPTEAVISQPNSPFQVAISNTQMEFRDGGVARAWLNASGFTAPVLSTGQLVLKFHEISDDPSGLGTVIKRR